MIFNVLRYVDEWYLEVVALQQSFNNLDLDSPDNWFMQADLNRIKINNEKNKYAICIFNINSKYCIISI